MYRRRSRSSTARRLAAGAVVVAAFGCSSDPVAEPTPAEYTTSLDAVCTETTASLDALVRPDDGGDVSAFAAAVASALRDESERVRALAVPAELDADHRAFLRNTDDQAARWEQLGTTPSTDPAFADVAREIGELTLGRNDLATEMGATACARTAG